MKKPPLKYVGSKAVRALLDRYACPVPFHVVRMRFLGNIASPKLDASPIKIIETLWGGEMPVFDADDDVGRNPDASKDRADDAESDSPDCPVQIAAKLGEVFLDCELGCEQVFPGCKVAFVGDVAAHGLVSKS